MVRAIFILFLTIFSLWVLLVLALGIDIPGYHIGGYPFHEEVAFTLYPWLTFTFICYIFSMKGKNRMPTMAFILYLLLSLPYPIALFYFEDKFISEFPAGEAAFITRTLFLCEVIYFGGQVFFIFKFAQILRKKQM